MSDQTVIAEGRAAWARIKDRDKASFDDWIAIGRALIAARRACMTRAKVNSPFGPVYQKHMRGWLDENGLGDIDSHERYASVLVVEHLGDIEAMRATWTEKELRRGNHPSSILQCWRESRPPQRSGPKRYVEPDRRKAARPAEPAERPAQDLIRRVALAMKLSGRQDFFALAVVALESLTRADLIELLGERAKPAAREIQRELELQ